MANRRFFQGDLNLISALNLFQLIGLASLSGQLMIRCPENSTYFFFTGGKANYGFSREGHKKIGQTLLEYQLITRGQLNICLALQQISETKKKLGSIVVEVGYLQKSQLIDLLSRQIKDALFETLTWTEGNFTFVDTSPLTDGDIVLEESIDSLILQLLFVFDNLNQILC